MHCFTKVLNLQKLDKHEKAIEIFDQILSKHKENVNIIYAKSRSKAELGMYPESLDVVETCNLKKPQSNSFLGKRRENIQKTTQQ